MARTPKKVGTSLRNDLNEAYKGDLLMRVMVWMLICSTCTMCASFAGLEWEAFHRDHSKQVLAAQNMPSH